METEIRQLNERVQLLESLVLGFIRSDRHVFNKTLQIMEGKNILLGTATGTKIGTATGQKIGIFNSTPVVQQSSTGETTGFTAGGGGTAVKDVSTFTGNTGSTAYTISDIVKHLKTYGWLAS